MRSSDVQPTTSSRAASEDAVASALLGDEAGLAKILPEAVDPTNLIDLDSESSTLGGGGVNCQESISLRIAALVTQVLPNGNLVLAGRQEVRVNYEKRALQVAGNLRPRSEERRVGKGGVRKGVSWWVAYNKKQH